MRAAGALVLTCCVLAACAGTPSAPSDVAKEACADARSVPLVADPGQDTYTAEPAELDAWVAALERAAGSAAEAASGDRAYSGLSTDLDAFRADIVLLRDTLADGGAVLGDDMSALQEHAATVVSACDGL